MAILRASAPQHAQRQQRYGGSLGAQAIAAQAHGAGSGTQQLSHLVRREVSFGPHQQQATTAGGGRWAPGGIGGRQASGRWLMLPFSQGG